jgi:ribosomal protein L16 Arg81 hydroxylase
MLEIDVEARAAGAGAARKPAATSDWPPGFANQPIPPYVFDAGLLSDVAGLFATDAEVVERAKNARPQEAIEPFSGLGALPMVAGGEIAVTQFILGPEGSGSPVHFHKDALNVALVGRKRWFLFPPSQRFWSAKPAAAWLAEDYLQLEDPPIELIQEAGDVVFVPADWGHGVVNLEDSLAVAVEVTWPVAADSRV